MTVKKKSTYPIRRRDRQRESDRELLNTDKFDVIKSWQVVRKNLQHLDYDHMEENFTITLVDQPTVIRTVMPKVYFRELRHQILRDGDTFYGITCNYGMQRWVTNDNGRTIERDVVDLPTPMMKIMYLADLRVYIGLDVDWKLVAIVLVRGVLVQILHGEQVYSAKQMLFISETKQLIICGSGFLRSFACSGLECSIAIEKGKEIKCSISKSTIVHSMRLDLVYKRLFVCAGQCVIIIDYIPMTEHTSVKDPLGGVCGCIAFYRKTEYVITGSKVGIIKVWSPKMSVAIHEFVASGHREPVTELECHEREPLLVSITPVGVVIVWRMDTFRKYKELRVGEDVFSFAFVKDTGVTAFFVQTRDKVTFYELDDFYRLFASLESSVCRLQRCNGLGEHPNRLMVVTFDGGMRYLNCITGLSVGVMYPITTLKITDMDYAYNALRQRLYMQLMEGTVLELGCKKSPLRALELLEPKTHDECVICMCSVTIVIGNPGSEIEDLVIFLGLKNGQIMMLSSECFTLPRPVQAHVGLVAHLEALTEATPDGNEVYRTNNIMVSCGSDLVFKVWRLRCHPHDTAGLELKFHCLFSMRGHEMPRLLSAANDRICIVSENKCIVYMYDISLGLAEPDDIPIGKLYKELRHTPDYDHTKEIFAISKCPLLCIFLTASLDYTVRFWDKDCQMLRELVLFEPITGACFLTEIGDVVIAKENIIVAVPVEKYLPWYMLKEMAGKDFKEEEREFSLKHEEVKRCWIDPNRVPKKGIPRFTQHYLTRQAALRDELIVCDWNLTWEGSRGKVHSMCVPVTCRKKQRTKAGQPVKKLSVVMPVRGQVATSRDPSARSLWSTDSIMGEQETSTSSFDISMTDLERDLLEHIRFALDAGGPEIVKALVDKISGKTLNTADCQAVVLRAMYEAALSTGDLTALDCFKDINVRDVTLRELLDRQFEEATKAQALQDWKFQVKAVVSSATAITVDKQDTKRRSTWRKKRKNKSFQVTVIPKEKMTRWQFFHEQAGQRSTGVAAFTKSRRSAIDHLAEAISTKPQSEWTAADKLTMVVFQLKQKHQVVEPPVKPPPVPVPARRTRPKPQKRQQWFLPSIQSSSDTRVFQDKQKEAEKEEDPVIKMLGYGDIAEDYDVLRTVTKPKKSFSDRGAEADSMKRSLHDSYSDGVSDDISSSDSSDDKVTLSVTSIEPELTTDKSEVGGEENQIPSDTDATQTAGQKAKKKQLTVKEMLGQDKIVDLHKSRSQELIHLLESKRQDESSGLQISIMAADIPSRNGPKKGSAVLEELADNGEHFLVTEEEMNTFKRKMKAGQLPNSAFRRIPVLKPKPPPTWEEQMQQKVREIIEIEPVPDVEEPQPEVVLEESGTEIKSSDRRNKLVSFVPVRKPLRKERKEPPKRPKSALPSLPQKKRKAIPRAIHALKIRRDSLISPKSTSPATSPETSTERPVHDASTLATKGHAALQVVNLPFSDRAVTGAMHGLAVPKTVHEILRNLNDEDWFPKGTALSVDAVFETLMQTLEEDTNIEVTIKVIRYYLRELNKKFKLPQALISKAQTQILRMMKTEEKDVLLACLGILPEICEKINKEILRNVTPLLAFNDDDVQNCLKEVLSKYGIEDKGRMLLALKEHGLIKERNNRSFQSEALSFLQDKLKQESDLKKRKRRRSTWKGSADAGSRRRTSEMLDRRSTAGSDGFSRGKSTPVPSQSGSVDRKPKASASAILAEEYSRRKKLSIEGYETIGRRKSIAESETRRGLVSSDSEADAQASAGMLKLNSPPTKDALDKIVSSSIVVSSGTGTEDAMPAGSLSVTSLADKGGVVYGQITVVGVEDDNTQFQPDTYVSGAEGGLTAWSRTRSSFSTLGLVVGVMTSMRAKAEKKQKEKNAALEREKEEREKEEREKEERRTEERINVPLSAADLHVSWGEMYNAAVQSNSRTGRKTSHQVPNLILSSLSTAFGLYCGKAPIRPMRHPGRRGSMTGDWRPSISQVSEASGGTVEQALPQRTEEWKVGLPHGGEFATVLKSVRVDREGALSQMKALYAHRQALHAQTEPRRPAQKTTGISKPVSPTPASGIRQEPPTQTSGVVRQASALTAGRQQCHRDEALAPEKKYEPLPTGDKKMWFRDDSVRPAHSREHIDITKAGSGQQLLTRQSKTELSTLSRLHSKPPTLTIGKEMCFEDESLAAETTDDSLRPRMIVRVPTPADFGPIPFIITKAYSREQSLTLQSKTGSTSSLQSKAVSFDLETRSPSESLAQITRKREQTLTRERCIREESPTRERRIREESPTREIRSREELLTREIRSRGESMTRIISREIRSFEESPTRETRSGEKSPTREKRSGEESLTRDKRSREGSLTREIPEISIQVVLSAPEVRSIDASNTSMHPADTAIYVPEEMTEGLLQTKDSVVRDSVKQELGLQPMTQRRTPKLPSTDRSLPAQAPQDRGTLFVIPQPRTPRDPEALARAAIDPASLGRQPLGYETRDRKTISQESIGRQAVDRERLGREQEGYGMHSRSILSQETIGRQPVDQGEWLRQEQQSYETRSRSILSQESMRLEWPDDEILPEEEVLYPLPSPDTYGRACPHIFPPTPPSGPYPPWTRICPRDSQEQPMFGTEKRMRLWNALGVVPPPAQPAESRRERQRRFLQICLAEKMRARARRFKWVPGEAGLRVVQGFSLTSDDKRKEKGSDEMYPHRVQPLQGRLGSMAPDIESGSTRFGCLNLAWTTRTPAVPICPEERASQLMRVNSSSLTLRSRWGSGQCDHHGALKKTRRYTCARMVPDLTSGLVADYGHRAQNTNRSCLVLNPVQAKRGVHVPVHPGRRLKSLTDDFPPDALTRSSLSSLPPQVQDAIFRKLFM